MSKAGTASGNDEGRGRGNGTIRCGVIGVGRMGRHHARVYAQAPDTELVGVVDANAERAGDVAEQWGCRHFHNVENLLNAGVDCVSIAVPTTYHKDAAIKCLAADVSCLVEKPLAGTVEDAQAIKHAAEASRGVLMVGHIERFNPIMRALRAEQATNIPLIPRFMEVHRVSPMTFRSVDVGVVMDMMIHDLDVVLMLMGGQEPDEVHASGVPVITEHEDICNARLVWNHAGPGGGRCVANVTASRLALKTERVTRQLTVTAENCQTTQDVVKELQADFPSFEYRRIPLSDEKSPDPASLDEVRGYLNEMSAKYGKQSPQFVFNCHQGKGRTTTTMVTAGITMDGRGPRQLELPFEETRERTERNIRENAQLQNLNTTVDEYKKKAQSAEARAEALEKQLADTTLNRSQRADLGAQARRAHADAAKYRENAQEFTKRYALMQKYSEYVTEHGSNAQHPTFAEWMKSEAQQSDLNDKWAALNQQCGLERPAGPFYEPQTMAA